LDVGVFTWCQVIMLALLNMCRVDISKALGIPCARMAKEVVEAATAAALSSSSPVGNENNEHNPMPAVLIDLECAGYNLGVFALSGLCMCLGAACLLLMARIYEFRLVFKSIYFKTLIYFLLCMNLLFFYSCAYYIIIIATINITINFNEQRFNT